jgi:predicted RND superfamily exporter protein/outer membrane lipoprotein-sorting protein
MTATQKGNRLGSFKDTDKSQLVYSYFHFITEFPRRIIALGIVFILVTGMFIPSLVKDTTIDAFIAPENAAIQYRDKVKELFGLKDPIIVALVGEGENAIYQPAPLALVRDITNAIMTMDNVDPNKVMSLATEMSIRGTETDLFVDPLIPEGLITEETAEIARNQVNAMPLYLGNLVANDGSATLIVAEVLEQRLSGKTYEAILSHVAELAPTGYAIHVAGVGAVDGYLSAYIDKDTRRMMPFVVGVIIAMMFIAFRTPRSVGLPLIIVAGTASGTIGTMAAFGIPYFAITSALPVILVGISVADSIHVLTYYYTEQKAYPNRSSREIVIHACSSVWRPLVLTSVTTTIGFAGIAVTTNMPPMMWFSVFAIVGVMTALVLTLTVLPAALSLCKPMPCKALADQKRGGIVTRVLNHIGSVALARPLLVNGIALAIVIVGVMGTNNLMVERETVNNFQNGEPIRVADELINERFNGTTYLDVVIEVPDEGGLYEPEVLKKVEALQVYLESLPAIQGSVSIVDYLKQLNKALNADDPAYYRVPDNRDLIEQLFLVHSATGDPTDFEEEVDTNFQTALVRSNLNIGLFSTVSETVQRVESYIAREFPDDSVKASLSGRAKLDHNWLSPLKKNHFTSLGVSILLIWVAASLLFRSSVAGTITLIPVVVAILMIYAVMGVFGIWLEPATSMFAPIAIGIGVDFSIHTVERVRYYTRNKGLSLEEAMPIVTATSGRALFYNFASIFLGFSMVLFSELPTLNRFGELTTIALASSYLMALVVVPALIAILGTGRVFKPVKQKRAFSMATVVFIVATSVFMVSDAGQAQDTPEGRALGEKIVARAEAENIDQTITMVLTDRRGRTKERTARMLRKTGEDQRRMIIAFSKPANIKNTAFMTHDFNESTKSDNQWLYLPALRRSRRISASDRGDYFLGTDFTYEDIKDSTKFSLSDYQFAKEGVEEIAGLVYPILILTPISDTIAKELGYSKVRVAVDEETAMPVRAEYWDTAGNKLKTIDLEDRVNLGGFWTARKITATNHKTGHMTLFALSDIDYNVDLKLSTFTERKLRTGL